MKMTPDDWVNAVSKAAASADWGPIEKLRYQINQHYADLHEDAGLEQFHDAALRLCVDTATYDQRHVKNIQPFEEAIKSAISQGIGRANRNPEIRSIYFEYFYDGGEGCTGDLYLCTAYSDQNDEWAAEFDSSDIIEGPIVNNYLDYDRGLEFEPRLDCIARYYVNACFLAACIRAWQAVGSSELPFGFAEHDDYIVRLRPA